MNSNELYARARGQRKTRRAEFTPEERKLILELIQDAIVCADPDYVADTAGFWLERQARPIERCTHA